MTGRRTLNLLLLRRALAAALVLSAAAPLLLLHRFQPAHVGGAAPSPVRTVADRRAGDVGRGAEDDDVPLPPGIGGAGRALLRAALRRRPVFDAAVDPEAEAARCRRYFSYENSQRNFSEYAGRPRRRLFLGSLLADDSWHALGAVALETYGVYAAVAFVESNRTQTGAPRALRFVPGTVDHRILVERPLFGPDTPVVVAQFVHEGPLDGGGLVREQAQRHRLLDLWRAAGMTVDDVGVLTDADETPTRDFLRAVQACDLPQLDPERQDCRAAKVASASVVFEGSPECMTSTRKWMHPDLILGKCVEGIGDDAFRLTEGQRQRRHAWRRKEYTLKDGGYSGWPKEKTTYPLWNAADFRRDQGGLTIMFEDVDYLPFRMGHTGYHFHNYFESTRALRRKYLTYGHPIPGAGNMTVAEMQPDLDVMVDCVLGRPAADNRHATLATRLADFPGRAPLAYGLDGYAAARHAELRAMLLADERGHGTTWHDNPKARDWFERIPP